MPSYKTAVKLGFDWNMHPPHLANVRRQQGAVHPLFACLERKGLHLLIRHLLESPVQKILPCLLHIFRQPLTEVVQRPEIKIPFPQVPIPQGVAHLHIVAKLVVHLLVAPTMRGLKKLQPHQHIHRHIGAGRYIGI